MILIFSTSDDFSTTMVAEWLIRYNKKYIQINGDDHTTRFDHYDITNGKLIITQKGKHINLLDADSIWYRRRGITLKSLRLSRTGYFSNVLHDIPSYHVRHNEREFQSLMDFVFYVLQGKSRVLGNYFHSTPNKLRVLEMAKKHGLMIPESYVVTTRAGLKALPARSGSMITKALSDGVYVMTKKYGYYSYTEKLKPEFIKALPGSFFPSLIQPEIRKKYELRVFCLHDQVYSMAIFSQRSKGTQTDFRKAGPGDTFRSVPYRLPAHIGKILLRLLKELQLNTGSFDLIVDVNNNYIFLEVNPVGQFTMTSNPCNYYLEKKVAEIL
jgi:ATP-GRASP peptide maturase of grasp-with-spasm system